MNKQLVLNHQTNLMSKITAYIQLMKLRLSALVVFSAFIGFLLGTSGDVEWLKLLMLSLGGLLVTGSANAFNQVIEKDLDKLMDRTAGRPLPQARVTPGEAIIVAAASGIIGSLILTIFLNPASGLLGIIATILYAAVYTPMKTMTPFAVFIGAFPGAIPPLLGWVAATGTFSTEGWVLFGIQFIWQFPHFWSIAWVLDDDYKKAGFSLLPSKAGRDKASAFQIFVYSFSLIPLGLLPYIFGMTGKLGVGLIAIAGLYITILSLRLYNNLDITSAKKVMFGSFIYLPAVLISLLID
jgi:protoheme IX farnesyltransferase